MNKRDRKFKREDKEEEKIYLIKDLLIRIVGIAKREDI